MKIHAAVLLVAICTSVTSAEPIEIGSRLELLVDDHLIDKLSGDAQLKLHRPQPREVVLTTDSPWEGNTCAYYSIFRDGDVFRMYYRGSHWDTQEKKAAHREVTCYAESKDGIHWVKPKLGIVEFNGSKDNNIVWDGLGTHCFTVFKDANPECAPDAKYKGISANGRKGLFIFKSPDAIHWEMIQQEPVITEGYFDSQNLAFWDPHTKQYREYHRTFINGVRSIMTGTSRDFVQWTKPVLLKYGDAPNEHLYTNAVRTYDRAPHFMLGFPTRYLPKEGQRVEPVFMSSRDGLTFKRWTEPVVPESAPKDRGGNRSNYMTWGLVQLPGNDRELSVYATEAYYTGPDSRVRRFAYRVDGFVSLNSADAGGLVSKPVKFTGQQLVLNYAAGEGGSIGVELLDASGKAIDGFTLSDCDKLAGDEITKTVSWQNSTNVSKLAGKAIRLRFTLKNADLYSFRFAK